MRIATTRLTAGRSQDIWASVLGAETLQSTGGYGTVKDHTSRTDGGRPMYGLPCQREQSAILFNHVRDRRSAVRLEMIARIRTGIHISHCTIHNIER